MNKQLKLKCPSCGKTEHVPFDRSDPDGAVELHVICPDCDDGDFHEGRYYDQHGWLIVEYNYDV